jgi:hypothetical protein
MASRGQALTLAVYAYDTAAPGPKTGDAANLTLRLVKDGGTPAAPTNAAAEIDATNLPGWYQVALTAGECTCHSLVLGGKSSTSGVVVTGTQVTFEQLPTALVGGRVDANVGAWAGGSLPATTDLFGTVYLRARVTTVEFGAITATAFAAGAIGVTAIAAGAIGSDQLDLSAVDAIQAGLPTAAENAAAWGASVVGSGRTRDYYLQGGTNLIAFAADGLSWTLYATDDATPLQAGTATRLAASVGGLRGVDPT